jgi:hypothetical protein
MRIFAVDAVVQSVESSQRGDRDQRRDERIFDCGSASPAPENVR